MLTAMEHIVDGYVRLNDRKALEDILAHRRKLVFDLKTRSSGAYDFGPQLKQLDDDIAVIAAGLAEFDQADAGEGTPSQFAES
jgi:uncharacterized protein with von Willebrand factor type A (vWA) domain